MSTLSIKNQDALDALRSAVTEALDRKRRLGLYAVIWRDGQVVRIEPEDEAASGPADRRPTRERRQSMSTMSDDDQRALDALRSAVAEALDRKRRLGQYAVIWRDGQVVRIEPEDEAASGPQGHNESRA